MVLTKYTMQVAKHNRKLAQMVCMGGRNWPRLIVIGCDEDSLRLSYPSPKSPLARRHRPPVGS